MIDAVRLLKSSQNEGLFRVTPDYATLSALQLELESKGQIESTPLDQLDIHIVAALLKHFYRQLDPRLISESLTLELRQTVNNFSATRAVLSKLQQPFKDNFQYLILALAQIIKRTECQTKMNVQNIAIVFAPNIFFDYQRGDEQVLKFIIEFGDKLWEQSPQATSE